MRRAVFLVALAACSAREDDREAAPVPVPVPQAPPAPAPAPRPTQPSDYQFTVEWSEIKATEGCFFFSGPDGRDDKLGPHVEVRREEPDRVELRFGSAVFSGTARNGELEVTRDSSHDFDGRWTVTERIHGRAREEREMHARYRYQECEVGQHCPGTCRIDAKLVLRPR